MLLMVVVAEEGRGRGMVVDEGVVVVVEAGEVQPLMMMVQLLMLWVLGLVMVTEQRFRMVEGMDKGGVLEGGKGKDMLMRKQEDLKIKMHIYQIDK